MGKGTKKPKTWKEQTLFHKVLIIIGVVGLFLLALDFLNLLGSNDTAIGETSSVENQQKDSVILRAEPYMNKIVYEDVGLRSLASSATKGCPSGNKECQLNKVYRYVVENYDYYSDPRSAEFIQSPADTLKVKGGDCEDLTILMSSLLENLGFKTYLIMTEDHAYSLACGVDTDRLWDYIAESLTENYAEEFGKDEEELIARVIDGKLYLTQREVQTIAINPGFVYYYGGEGEAFTDSEEWLDIKYSISSSGPIDIYFVPSKQEFEKYIEKEGANRYTSCSKINVLQTSASCKYLKENGGIMLENKNNNERINVKLILEFSFAVSTNSLFSDQEIKYYEIEGDKCVVLEATAGKEGFPGYTSTTGKKIAIDPVTKKYYSLN